MTSKSKVTVVNSRGRPSWLNVRNIVVALVLLALAGGGIYWFALRNSNNANKTANAADQKALQSSLQASVASMSDTQGVIYSAGRLISGQKDGTFTIASSDLSQIYLERATAYTNLGQYKNAVSDYEQAVTLGGLNEYAALQGEVEARYKLGDRQSLIPLYQQLMDMAKNSQDPMHNSAVAQYEENIQALQNGQGLSF